MAGTADRLDRGLARGVDDVLAKPVEIGDAELLHHLDEAAATFIVAGGERINVALDLKRFAHIGAMMRNRSAFIRPSRARAISGIDNPSAWTCRPSGPIPSPPMSTTCTVLAKRPTASPRRKVGLTTVRSCRWPPVSQPSSEFGQRNLNAAARGFIHKHQKSIAAATQLLVSV